MDILQKLSEELDIKYDNVVKTVELLDEETQFHLSPDIEKKLLEI